MKFKVETGAHVIMASLDMACCRANLELEVIKAETQGLDTERHSCIWEDHGRSFNCSEVDVFTSTFEIVPFSPEIDSLSKIIERWESMAAFPEIRC